MPTAHNWVKTNLVWDNHGCMPLRPFDVSFLPQLRRYRESGTNVAMLNIGFGDQGIEEHIRVLPSPSVSIAGPSFLHPQGGGAEK